MVRTRKCYIKQFNPIKYGFTINCFCQCNFKKGCNFDFLFIVTYIIVPNKKSFICIRTLCSNQLRLVIVVKMPGCQIYYDQINATFRTNCQLRIALIAFLIFYHIFLSPLHGFMLISSILLHIRSLTRTFCLHIIIMKLIKMVTHVRNKIFAIL